MADKDLQKDALDEDLDGIISFMMQGMMLIMFTFALMTIVPAAQTAQQYYESQLYQGEPDSRTLHATGTIQHIVLSNSWIGALFINDGPDDVDIWINDASSQPYNIKVGETLTVNRSGAQNRIYAIYFQCTSGGTAAIRVDGVF